MATRMTDQSIAIERLTEELEELKRQINLGSQLSQIASSIIAVNETIKGLTPAPKTPMKADLQEQILRIRNSHLRRTTR